MCYKKKIENASGFGIASCVFYAALMIVYLASHYHSFSIHSEYGRDLCEMLCLSPIGLVCSFTSAVSILFLLDVKRCLVKLAFITLLYYFMFLWIYLFAYNGYGFPKCTTYALGLMMTCFCFPSLICIARKYIKSYFKYAMIFGSAGSMMSMATFIIRPPISVIYAIVVSIVSSLLIAVGFYGLYLNRKFIGKIIDAEKTIASSTWREKALSFYSYSIMAIGPFVFLLTLSFAAPNECFQDWCFGFIAFGSCVLLASVLLGVFVRWQIKANSSASPIANGNRSAWSQIIFSLVAVVSYAVSIAGVSFFVWSLSTSYPDFSDCITDGLVSNLKLVDLKYRIDSVMSDQFYFSIMMLFVALCSFGISVLLTPRGLKKNMWLALLGVVLGVLPITMFGLRPKIVGLFGEELGGIVDASRCRAIEDDSGFSKCPYMAELKDPSVLFPIYTSTSKSTTVSYYVTTNSFGKTEGLHFWSHVTSESHFPQFLESVSEVMDELKEQYGSPDLEYVHTVGACEVSEAAWHVNGRVLTSVLRKKGSHCRTFYVVATPYDRAVASDAYAYVYNDKDSRERWNDVKDKLPRSYVNRVENKIAEWEIVKHRTTVIDPKVRAFLKEHLNVQFGDPIDKFEQDKNGKVVIPVAKPYCHFNKALGEHVAGKLVGILLYAEIPKKDSSESVAGKDRQATSQLALSLGCDRDAFFVMSCRSDSPMSYRDVCLAMSRADSCKRPTYYVNEYHGQDGDLGISGIRFEDSCLKNRLLNVKRARRREHGSKNKSAARNY